MLYYLKCARWSDSSQKQEWFSSFCFPYFDEWPKVLEQHVLEASILNTTPKIGLLHKNPKLELPWSKVRRFNCLITFFEIEIHDTHIETYKGTKWIIQIIYEEDKIISRVQMLLPSNLGFLTQWPLPGPVHVLILVEIQNHSYSSVMSWHKNIWYHVEISWNSKFNAKKEISPSTYKVSRIVALWISASRM